MIQCIDDLKGTVKKHSQLGVYYRLRSWEMIHLVACMDLSVRPSLWDQPCVLPQQYSTMLCTPDLHCAPLTCICIMVHKGTQWCRIPIKGNLYIFFTGVCLCVWRASCLVHHTPDLNCFFHNVQHPPCCWQRTHAWPCNLDFLIYPHVSIGQEKWCHKEKSGYFFIFSDTPWNFLIHPTKPKHTGKIAIYRDKSKRVGTTLFRMHTGYISRILPTFHLETTQWDVVS